MPDFLPRKDADLLSWSASFNQNLSLSPGEYGITVSQSDQYDALHIAFADAYQIATQNDTRTSPAISAKDDAREALKSMARMLARIVRASPTVTTAQRLALGLGRQDGGSSPINAPDSPPLLFVDGVQGRRVILRLGDSTSPTRLGKPRGVAGATIFSFVGDQPPAGMSDWAFQGNTSDRFVNIDFPASVPAGSIVWFTACWFNPRMQAGPMAFHRQTWLQGGVAMAA